MVRILFLGDIVGKVGRRAVKDHLPRLREEYTPDLIIANGENASGGAGIDERTAGEIYAAGVDFITTGNHVWNRREVFPYLNAHPEKIIRPVNFSKQAPGRGMALVKTKSGIELAVVNLIARVFMPDLVDDPFQAIEKVLENIQTPVRFVDFHGEATSEKVAMAYFLDGSASCLVGTHTHVQTADERILEKGLAYISDVGMCGALESVIGVEARKVVERFTTGMPARFDTAKGRALINGIVVDIDEGNGRALKIERIRIEEERAPG